MTTPRGYRTVRGKSPTGHGTAEFHVSIKKIKDLQRYGPAWKFYDAFLLDESLATPKAIFQGLLREGLEDAYCYSAVPSKRLKSMQIELPFPPNLVFVVHIEQSQSKGLVILDWEMRQCDKQHRGLPHNWEQDFARQVWPPA